METETWDVFISHASEDKEEIARPMYDKLKGFGIKSWYDAKEIKYGQSLVEKISNGLKNTTYIIIVFSPNFLKKDKKWTKEEELISAFLKTEYNKEIIPIYHNTTDKILEKINIFIRPLLAYSTDNTNISSISKEITKDILETKIVELIYPTIEMDELKNLIFKYTDKLNLIRNEIKNSSQYILEHLCQLECEFIPILRDIQQRKKIENPYIEHYIRFLTLYYKDCHEEKQIIVKPKSFINYSTEDKKFGGINIFLSYSTKDYNYKDEIKITLSKLERDGKIKLWIDEKELKAGEKFNKIIKAEINKADMFLLLLSRYFWDSDYILEYELPLILKRYQAIVVPIVLNDTFDLKEHDEVREINGLPRCIEGSKELKAIDDFKSPSKAYNSILKGISKLFPIVTDIPINNKKEVIKDENRFYKNYQETILKIKNNTVPIKIERKILNVSIYPVTFEEYDLYCEDMKIKNKPNDYNWGRGNRPVIDVSWDDAIKYCNWLSKKENKNYRLLTYKEWINIAKRDISNKNFKSYIVHSKSKTKKVASKKEGELGLYDFVGNIYEWCRKENGEIYIRGICFNDKIISLDKLLSNELLIEDTTHTDYRIGFRVVYS